MSKGIYRGSIVIDGRFDGILNGNATVPAGASAEIAGIINGRLVVEQGAVVRISGIVNGSVIDHGSAITVSGIVSEPSAA